MELDFRKLEVTKLFDFSKEEEKLIIEIYDQLSKIYSISVTDIEDSPYNQFCFDNTNPLKTPKICYYITNKDKTNTFYLFIINTVVNTIGASSKGSRTADKYDTIEIWGLKKLDDDFGFISVTRKNIADKIAEIFSSSDSNFRDFKNHSFQGSDSSKTLAFLNPRRKEIIKAFPDKDFRLDIKNNILGFGLPQTLNVNNALIVSKFLNEI
ncbi:hypothetical protein [Chryseobacterium aurantiacum]|uniref:hypothetical protein n=1 Tax=Chryseobacterium aurantiacum TaxID=2116499 RepID=UPI000D1280E1|nr:hypothetical protein [Chryseobacterium aurantiacum]